MPRGNGMGPMGMGPMTGRGAGYCAGYATPGFTNAMVGGGMFGRGRGGGGRGWRNMFYATGLPGWARMGQGVPNPAMAAGAFQGMTREQELVTLKQQAEQLADALEGIRRRIHEVEGKTE